MKKRIGFLIFLVILICIFDGLKILNQESEKIESKKLKKSGFWILKFIHIDDNIVGNWTATAGEEWCTGSGTWSDPYIIENVSIDSASSPSRSGILIENSRNVYFIIKNCIVYNAVSAYYDSGIKLVNVNNGTLINNNCSNNDDGIRLRSSSNNIISGNIVNNNTNHGIILNKYCDNNTILGNIARNNLYGIRLISSSYNIISENSVTDNNYSELLLRQATGIKLYNSTNNLISRNNASNNEGFGMFIERSRHNTISKNIVNDNTLDGIFLYLFSINNTILGNLIKNNENIGINIYDVNNQNNLIYYNVLIGTSEKYANDGGINNHWNTTNVGNYWDNHTSPDPDNDGIVNDPYTWIFGGSGNVDNFPLKMSPIHDGEKIHIDNSGVSGYNWSITAKIKTWVSGSGTYSNPYVIDGLEIDGRRSGSGILIGNSSVYFIIKNCRIYNAGSGFNDAGIKLEDVDNGTLINNNCSFNQHGIYLTFSNNITISGNTANNNTINGIFLYDQCNDNKILTNTANFNAKQPTSGDGVNIRNSSRNLIIDNNVSNNAGRGMDLVYVYDTVIINNTANNNGPHPNVMGEGITVQLSQNITVSFNNIEGNGHGMCIYNIEDCKIFKNEVTYNYWSGIKIEDSKDIIAFQNIVSHNRNGISLSDYANNENNNYNVSGNILKDNYYGIYLYKGGNNTISENRVYNNSMDGIILRESVNSKISQNIVYNNWQGIRLEYSNDIIIIENRFYNNSDDGIYLSHSNTNFILKNQIYNNGNGTRIYNSNFTLIKKNNFSNCEYNGIRFMALSNGNLIYRNNFIGNLINAEDFGFNNNWDNGAIGNYWDDYLGLDIDDNGIGDVPYNITGSAGSQDNFPIWDDGPDDQGDDNGDDNGDENGDDNENENGDDIIPGYIPMLIVATLCVVVIIIIKKKK